VVTSCRPEGAEGRSGLTAEDEFLGALGALRTRYDEQPFWCERDLVYWLQLHLRASLPTSMQVFNDYGMLPGPRRSQSTDLAIVDSGDVLLAAEFKFEPSKGRRDIMENKLPVIGWSDVDKDIGRIQQYVATEKTPVAWSVCVDEASRWTSKPRHFASVVERWPTRHGTEVTLTRWPSDWSPIESATRL
jgi:hypothetical protein